MAKFNYVATKDGKEVKGTIEAGSMEEAKSRLRDRGNVILSIKGSKSLSDASWNIQIGTGVSKKDITIFCKQFYSILKAGVTIIDGLHMVEEQTENKNLKKAIYNVQVSVEKGQSLADAMAGEGKVFPEILINMVAAGEATGNLEVAFDRICSQFDKDLKLTSMVRSAMIYPIVVLVIAVGVVAILMTTVIPNFQEAFVQMGEELPTVTKMVIAVSDFMVENKIALLIGLVVLIILIMLSMTTETMKKITSYLALKIPMFRNFSVKNAAARFSLTMSTLIMSGVPIVEALGIVANVISNRIIRQAIKDCQGEVMQGVPMSEPIEASGIFPPMLYHMLRIGEETGTTEQMLDRVAEFYEAEVEEATKNLTAIMEPAIIVVLAVVVGGVVGSIVMPMLTIYESAGNA